MSGYTHRATWPNDPQEKKNRDRVVIHNGLMLGRVQQIDGGPQNGRWDWATKWSGHLSGVADTLDEAVQLIKDAHSRCTDHDLELIKMFNRPRYWKGVRQ